MPARRTVSGWTVGGGDQFALSILLHSCSVEIGAVFHSGLLVPPIENTSVVETDICERKSLFLQQWYSSPSHYGHLLL